MKNTDLFQALRYKDFRIFLGIRTCFTLAAQVQTVMIGFYIYSLTHSKVAIAFVGLSEVLPAIGLALFGGYIADRLEKRKLLIMTYWAMLVISLLMGLVTWPAMGLQPGKILAAVYLLLFLSGIVRAFYQPASFALYAHSIPREVFVNGSTWSNIGWQGASIIGPLLGGAVYAAGESAGHGWSGITGAYTVILIFLIITLFLAYNLNPVPLIPVNATDKRKEAMAGLRFVFGNRILLYSMSLDLFSVLFGGVIALLPVYAIDILKVGATGMGLMRMAFSLGAALTMLLMIRWSPMGRPWRNLLIVVTGYGIAILCFGLSRMMFTSLVFLFLQGAFDSVSVVIRSTLMQLLTPDHIRGRVSAVNSMFIGSSAEIGDFESGMAAKLLGTVPAVLFGGGMVLVIAGFTYLKTRSLVPLTLDDLRITPVVPAEAQIVAVSN